MSFDVLAILCLFFLSLNAHADDNVILITADRIQSNSDKSSSDVQIFTNETIQKSLSLTLPELLAKESDLNLVSSGPNGSNTSLFLRGTDSSHTLVVIDGITMNDPSNPNRQYDIGRLSLNNIEKIEILKGSQGLAYGSNAIGGVIVITTKKAKNNKLVGETYLDYGTFNTVNAGFNTQEKIGQQNLSFGADYLNTTGFSAADKKYNPNAEKDGDHRVTLSSGFNSQLSSQYALDVNLRYVHNVADLDKGGGPNNDDPNDRQKEEELYSKIQLTKDWGEGNAQTKFSYNRSKHYRLLEVRPDALNPQSSNTTSSGEVNAFAINHTYYLSEKLTQNLNLDWQHEKDQSEHYNQNLSGFLYHQYELSSSIFNFGLRLDHNKIFDDHLTYKAAAGYKFNTNLLKLSYSTGFRAPSLNQLFDPTYGNKTLTPETSQSVELSLEQNWSENLKTISTLFYTKINNRLSYDPNTFINRNSGAARITGFEENFTSKINHNFDVSLSMTLLKTRDLALGQKLARRPDINIKNIWSYNFFDRNNIDYELFYTGQRADVDNLGNPVKMNSYLISNLNYRYALNTKAELYLKIKNLFNKDYEEIYGYGTGGRAATIGAKYQF